MRWWFLGFLLVAAAGGAAVVSTAGGEEPLGTVRRGDLVLGVPTEGELEAVVSQQITPPQVERIWNFQIAMMAPEGSAVSPGQPVLGLDATELNQQLQQARAEAESAAKELEKFRSDVAVRRQQLELRLAEARARQQRAGLKATSDRQVTAEIELRKAAIDLGLAGQEITLLEEAQRQQATREWFESQNLTSRMQSARARVVSLEASIGRLTVTASRAGTVTYRSNWRGEKKEVGEQIWRAEVVLEIPDLSAMRATAEVDEAHAGRLRPGLEVQFRLDAYPDLEYRGTVDTIRRVVQRKSFESSAKVVILKMHLEETDVETMRPGMRFHGTIVTEVVENVVLVPAAAVFTSADGSYVEVVSRVGRRRVSPQFGRRNRDSVEVVSGLEAGDRILVRAAGGGV